MLIELSIISDLERIWRCIQSIVIHLNGALDTRAEFRVELPDPDGLFVLLQTCLT